MRQFLRYNVKWNKNESCYIHIMDTIWNGEQNALVSYRKHRKMPSNWGITQEDVSGLSNCLDDVHVSLVGRE